MSNRPIPDPVETAFRDLRGAAYTGEGSAAMAVVERRPALATRLGRALGGRGAFRRFKDELAEVPGPNLHALP